EAQGNKAAADALRREDPRNEVYYWYEDLQQSREHIEIVDAIEGRIRNKPDAPEVRELYRILAWHHKGVEDYARSEATWLRMFDQDPDDAWPLISLAEQKLYCEDDPEAAMAVIERALATAHRSGNLRRQALAVKARIALWLKRYDVVE